MRDWKMRTPPRKPLLPPDATPEEIAAAEIAHMDACDEDARVESALLAEAIGEISKIVLSFDDDSRHVLAQVLAVLGPEPEDDDKRDPWLETAETIKQVAGAYLAAHAAQQKHGCPDCAKKRASPPDGAHMHPPEGIAVSLTHEELRHLAQKFEAAISEIDDLRRGEAEPEDEKKA